MVEVKQMPYTEKHERVLSSINNEEYVPALIEKHLGKSAVDEYGQILEPGIQAIPENASPEER